MNLRFRVLGVLIIACGVAVCVGATQIWPAAAFGSSVTAIDVLRIVGAIVVALVGIGNVGAGIAVLVLKPARDNASST